MLAGNLPPPGCIFLTSRLESTGSTPWQKGSTSYYVTNNESKNYLWKSTFACLYEANFISNCWFFMKELYYILWYCIKGRSCNSFKGVCDTENLTQSVYNSPSQTRGNKFQSMLIFTSHSAKLYLYLYILELKTFMNTNEDQLDIYIMLKIYLTIVVSIFLRKAVILLLWAPYTLLSPQSLCLHFIFF